MTKAAIQEKVKNLESELEIIKRYINQEPDFDIDEKNWRKVKLTLKKTRKEIYKKSYGKK